MPLDAGQRVDEDRGQAETADGEVFHRPLGLGSVVSLGRHLDRPHAVMLLAKGHLGLSVSAGNGGSRRVDYDSINWAQSTSGAV